MAGSHSCSKVLNRFSIVNKPKFIDPMLRLASSGRHTAAGRTLSSTFM
jgi:hypothetical protein